MIGGNDWGRGAGVRRRVDTVKLGEFSLPGNQDCLHSKVTDCYQYSNGVNDDSKIEILMRCCFFRFYVFINRWFFRRAQI